ncbi:hypothetical protein BBJ28_00012607 [Nothophytophthora sp. Chile5]|nr:hypothetical protein BBJ28_00012607 [Nothophytophthora sp. Chile5]
MDEQASVVALAAALANVRALDADVRVPFADVFCALEAVESLLFEHKGRFGVLSVLFQRGCEEFLLLSNTLAMQALQTASPQDSATTERCRELLERAEQHTRRTGYLRSLPEAQHASRRRVFLLLTLNNLACHAKHTRSPLAALGFLERALKLQLQSVEAGQSTAPASELALTRLNICAVLSQLERHAAAATHAKAAVAQLLQAQELDTEAAQLLLVAHYNLAVELEHLSEGKAARRQYELGRHGVEVIDAALLVGMSLPLVPALRLDDEHSSVHAVAKAAVDSAVRQAVHDVVQAVQNATQWLSQAVGHELLSQAVAAADQASASADSSSDSTTRVETDGESPSGAPGLPLPSLEPSDARIHAVAEVTVDEVVYEALHDVTQAVESATEWLTQAVRGELVSHAVAEAEAPAAVVPTAEPSTVGSEADETSLTPPGAAKVLLSLNAHAVAEATVDAVVLEAVQSVTQAVEDATDWLTLAIGDELVSRAVADAASIADVDPTTDSNASSKAEREPSPSAGAAPIQVPILRLPRSAHGREEASTAPLESSHHCLQLAQPFQQPSSRSSRQQHKSKLRDSACQTSPPSSPPPSPPRRRRSHDPNDDGAISASRTKHHSHSKHSSSNHTPDNSTEQKATGKKSTLLLPLASTRAAHPTAETTKALSPPRVTKSHARARKEGGTVVSPSKMRSGFCQRCVFEGRSCKVNDCLKHQLLK